MGLGAASHRVPSLGPAREGCLGSFAALDKDRKVGIAVLFQKKPARGGFVRRRQVEIQERRHGLVPSRVSPMVQHSAGRPPVGLCAGRSVVSVVNIVSNLHSRLSFCCRFSKAITQGSTSRILELFRY